MAPRTITKDLVPPSLDEDTVERKRVLNVLAQRRYRRRKKERLHELETRARFHEASGNTSVDQGRFFAAATAKYQVSTRSSRGDAYCSAREGPPSGASNDIFTIREIDGDLNLIESSGIDTHSQESNLISSDSLRPHSSIKSPNGLTSSSKKSTMEELLSLACIKEDELFWSQLATSSELNPEAVKPSDLDKQLADGIQCGFTGPFDDISAELQVDDAQFFTFPDDRLLEVPSLTLLNAAVKVAQRLRIGQLIWDFTAVSPFYTGIDSSPSTSSLPSLESSVPKSTASPANSVDLIDIPYHLRPTPIQRRIPHHPIIDLLPWPSTRDKLIQVFHLPVNFRPENARDPMGILRLVYDLEDDGGEGMRIFGQDPFEENIWEIGQLVFERWWWAFEFGVIDRCNRARDSRGERRLSLEKS